MTTLVSSLSDPHSRNVDEDETHEAGPLPVALLGVIALVVGDVTLTLAAIAAMG